MSTPGAQALIAAATEAAQYLSEVGEDFLDLADDDGGGCGAVIAQLRSALELFEAEQKAVTSP
jgi:hypothetical protein